MRDLACGLMIMGSAELASEYDAAQPSHPKNVHTKYYIFRALSHRNDAAAKKFVGKFLSSKPLRESIRDIKFEYSYDAVMALLD